MMLTEWATAWGVSGAALADLRARVLGLDCFVPSVPGTSRSEAAVQAAARVEASRKGLRVWRNNLGSYQHVETGQWIRYGLANDSKLVNEKIKSADLIGIRPRIIQPGDVGHLIGQFISIECKPEGWKPGNNDHDQAQQAWATLVVSLGGDARFVTREGQI